MGKEYKPENYEISFVLPKIVKFSSIEEVIDNTTGSNWGESNKTPINHIIVKRN